MYISALIIILFLYINFAGTVKKATKVAAALKKSTGRKSTRVHTKTHFYRPQTLKLARSPKIAVTAKGIQQSGHEIIKFPLTTESAMKKVEEQNPLVFIVDITANKRQIKAAVKKLYDIQAQKVNTLIRSVF